MSQIRELIDRALSPTNPKFRGVGFDPIWEISVGALERVLEAYEATVATRFAVVASAPSPCPHLVTDGDTGRCAACGTVAPRDAVGEFAGWVPTPEQRAEIIREANAATTTIVDKRDAELLRSILGHGEDFGDWGDDARAAARRVRARDGETRAEKPMLTGWLPMGDNWKREGGDADYNGVEVVNRYGSLHWEVWSKGGPDRPRCVAEGDTADLDAAKRAGDAAAVEWYRLPPVEQMPIPSVHIAASPEHVTAVVEANGPEIERLAHPRVDRMADAVEWALQLAKRGMVPRAGTRARWESLLAEHAETVRAQPSGNPGEFPRAPRDDAMAGELATLRQDAGLSAIRERQTREQLAACERALAERDGDARDGTPLLNLLDMLTADPGADIAASVIAEARATVNAMAGELAAVTKTLAKRDGWIAVELAQNAAEKDGNVSARRGLPYKVPDSLRDHAEAWEHGWTVASTAERLGVAEGELATLRIDLARSERERQEGLDTIKRLATEVGKMQEVMSEPRFEQEDAARLLRGYFPDFFYDDADDIDKRKPLPIADGIRAMAKALREDACARENAIETLRRELDEARAAVGREGVRGVVRVIGHVSEGEFVTVVLDAPYDGKSGDTVTIAKVPQ